jgi:hypothetical protein
MLLLNLPAVILEVGGQNRASFATDKNSVILCVVIHGPSFLGYMITSSTHYLSYLTIPHL